MEDALRGAAHRAAPRRLARLGTVRADFERALADPADPAITAAEIASELRRGVDYVRVTIAFTVTATDVADALAIVWDAFRTAARDDLTGWEGRVAGSLRRQETVRDLADGSLRSSGAVVREVLGLIVLPARPLLEVIRDLAQEGSSAGPSVGDAVGPCPVLRGQRAFLGAAVIQRPEGHALVLELAVLKTRLDLR